MGTAGTASSVFSLLILLAQSSTHRHQCCCSSSDPCRTVRCPSQTEHHPQLHVSCHDCSSCSNCLLLLWSLRLRCQGWWLLGYWADGRVGSEPWENCDDPTETFDHKWFGFLPEWWRRAFPRAWCNSHEVAARRRWWARCGWGWHGSGLAGGRCWRTRTWL